jgi:hypothetical protein
LEPEKHAGSTPRSALFGQNCSATGSDKKVQIVGWITNASTSHKLRSGIIQAWVEAITQEEPDVDVHRPPKAIVELLTSTAKNENPIWLRPQNTMEEG